ncbi:MAG: class I SAM-dependent methyltransferase, partial [Gammaproteobacteria bacterium]|nr:class I SAM-dependent methyltransferase [Gammaproteobacteria bacterium]
MGFSYISAYDSPGVHGKDDPSSQRPWDLSKEIINYAGFEKNLLDIGCGTACKLIFLAPYFKEIIGLDISEDMILAATNNIKKYQINNIKLY